MKKYTVSLAYFFAVSFCASASAPESRSNSNIYNAIDTTEDSQAPGDDVTTLRIVNDNKNLIKKTREEDSKVKSKQVVSLAIKSEDVKAASPPPMLMMLAQEALNYRGFYTGVPSGEMNARTFNALIKFQEKNNLEVTGQLDSRTLDALKLKLPSEPIINTKEQIYAE